jgi:uncharacterized protein (DUF952 family)
MTESVIYHMAHRADWAAASDEAPYAGSPDDRRDGFIHFSTATQVAESAAKHRAGQADLVLVTVAATRLGESLRWEPGRRDEAFPHLYGPLALDAVIDAVPLPLGEDGLHVFPVHIPPPHA